MKRARAEIFIAAASAVCVLGALVHQLLTPVNADMGWAFRGFVVLMAVPYSVVGAAIAIRSPNNRVGSLLQTMGLAFAVAGVISEYALHGLVYRPGSLPAAIAAAWVIQWAWTVTFGLSMFVFLLFPNGRFVSERWRRFAYFVGFSLVVAACGFGLAEGVLNSFTIRPAFNNPLGVDGLTADEAGIFMMPWLLSLAAASGSLFIRFRRSTGVERLQLKWLAVGGLFTAVVFFLPIVAPGAASRPCSRPSPRNPTWRSRPRRLGSLRSSDRSAPGCRTSSIVASIGESSTRSKPLPSSAFVYGTRSS